MIRQFSKKRIAFITTGLVLLLLSASGVFAQDTNFCKSAEAIEYGDVVEGTVDDDKSFIIFCFEGGAGDIAPMS
jgi:hypothetical protein